jgi:hypothetical protein
VLEEPIENGFGKVRVGDSLWRVKGGDAAAGTRARVTGTDGFVLVVEPEDYRFVPNKCPSAASRAAGSEHGRLERRRDRHLARGTGSGKRMATVRDS